MNVTAGLLHVLLGSTYIIGFGFLPFAELWRGWAELREVDRLGVALLLVSVTCGPHHIHHGLHILTGAPTTSAGLLAVAFAVPFGVVWVYLRSEVLFWNGSGNRHRPAHHPPWWIVTVLPAWVFVLGVVLGIVATQVAEDDEGVILERVPATIPHLIVVVCFFSVGSIFWTTMRAARHREKRWSLVGLCLTMVWPTCALTHIVFAVDLAHGTYEYDTHIIANSATAAAALYMLYEVVHERRRPRTPEQPSS